LNEKNFVFLLELKLNFLHYQESDFLPDAGESAGGPATGVGPSKVKSK
jgi:hypothetical protein